MQSHSLSVVIVAGGAGVRLGTSVPKAFVLLAGKPLFMHSLLQFIRYEAVGDIVLVTAASMIDEARTLCNAEGVASRVAFIAGGKERWESVRNGVKAVQSDWVLVHDAARPFVTHAVIDAVLEKSNNYDCVITVTPEVDTIREFANDRALETINRARVVRVGTPQLFKVSALKNAFKAVPEMTTLPTDEAMLMQTCGAEVGIAWGDPLNFKVTTPGDLTLAGALCAFTR
jgi:2-C-methyl-D-erythritol 4-phosphate cytidylyltransferase